jgi:Holliday junction resolvasome RuvABC endonuclease subunit
MKRTRTKAVTEKKQKKKKKKKGITPVRMPPENVNKQYGSILACDPSLTAWGWSIIKPNGDVAAAGVVKTKPADKKLRIRKGDDFVRRINELYYELTGVIKKHNVKIIVSELPHGSQSATAAKALGAVTALMQVTANFYGVGLEWYSEGDCKAAVLQRRSVSKADMITAISKLYKDVPWQGNKVANEAIADSLAVYHVALSQSPSVKMVQQNFKYLDLLN